MVFLERRIYFGNNDYKETTLTLPSQAYLFFYDKLNKANYYLELSLELAHLPLDDRLVNSLSSDLISDGGQWDMVVNLLEVSFSFKLLTTQLTLGQTYGVVPQAVYPESFHSSVSGPLNTLLKTKLREDALILRRLRASLPSTHPTLSADEITAALRAKKEELMQEVYAVMTATLGVPIRPDQTFNWEYYEDGPGGNGRAKTWQGTPREFYANIAQGKYKVRQRLYPPDSLQSDNVVCMQPTESFSLINDPRNSYGKLYTVDKLGNVWGGRPVLCMCF